MNFLGVLFGGLGIAKFFFDRMYTLTLTEILPQLVKVMQEQKGLRPGEKEKLLIDFANRLEKQIVLSKPPERHFGHVLNDFYEYLVPGPVRTLVSIPGYVLKYPLRFFFKKKKMEYFQESTRNLAVKGLWSFITPFLVSGYLAACFLAPVSLRQVFQIAPNWIKEAFRDCLFFFFVGRSFLSRLNLPEIPV